MKNWASAAVAGTSLWHADDPDGGTNLRGSIAENAHAPVPPPLPRRPAVLLHLAAPFLAMSGPGRPIPGATASWDPCGTLPAAMSGAPGATSPSARTVREDTSTRRRTATSSAAREEAIIDEEAYARACDDDEVDEKRWRERWRRGGRRGVRSTNHRGTSEERSMKKKFPWLQDEIKK
ncbi:hypothetical protein E2562_019841 [Oryza meyeriana var. granulata]|uniref:DUF834 domain-containing protein n=1 Tax=Oryza meyeriana var. granulata TaxID=110450 RepID=A0A6G1CRY2_9ORYZ|nr:hypothetical protein E2562_019841 [Oryza meyeriana var. granulata]